MLCVNYGLSMCCWWVNKVIDYLNPSRIYTDGRTAEDFTADKKCGNTQKLSGAERLIGEINARLDEIGIKPGEDCTDTEQDYTEEADNG